jgi:hypothetical protein
VVYCGDAGVAIRGLMENQPYFETLAWTLIMAGGIKVDIDWGWMANPVMQANNSSTRHPGLGDMWVT